MASGSRRVIYAALVGNALISVTKFIAAFSTGSSAMLSEGVHSVVDTGNQLLLLFGRGRARRPPDDKFPFGHGKEVYFWSFVVALLIFAVGAGVSIYEGVHRLRHPQPVANAATNYVVLALAFVFEGAAWTFAYREFKRTKGDMGYFEAVKRGKNPALFVVLFEDSAAMLGLLVAFVGIFLAEVTGNPYFDGGASVVIGLILGVTAAWLAFETHGLLIGESASTHVIRGIREIVTASPRINVVNEVLTVHMGPEFILVTLSVDFTDESLASEIEDAVAEVDRQIKERYPDVKRVFIEAEAMGRARRDESNPPAS